MPLIIRADANSQIGGGHLMRCLALGQGWKNRAREVIFITSCQHPALLQRLSEELFQIVLLDRAYPDANDWKITSQVLKKHPGSWVVLDGYHFDSTYQKLIIKNDCRLFLFDDCGKQSLYHAEAILNQNITAKNLHYSCNPGTQLLLGTDYVQLRSEFLPWRIWQRKIPKVARKILVTLGMGDSHKQVSKIIGALLRTEIDELEIRVIVNSSFDFQNLKSEINSSYFPVLFIQNPKSMPELMAWADLAISAGGSTCWELAFMGLPALLLILVKNQEAAVKMLDDRSIFQNGGWFTEIDEAVLAQKIKRLAQDDQLRKSMSEAGRIQVDGLGRERVIDFLDRSTQ